MENRHGLAVATAVTVHSGTAERETALPLLRRMRRRFRRCGQVTLRADKGYDTRQLVEDLRTAAVTPHVATGPHTTLDGRTTRPPGYGVSQTKRKRVEEIFGWLKTVGLMRQTRHRGRKRVGWLFTFATAVYNLVRLRTLTTVPA